MSLPVIASPAVLSLLLVLAWAWAWSGSDAPPARPTPSPSAESLMDRKLTVSFSKGSVYDLVLLLHQKHVPLSFIEGGDGGVVSIQRTDTRLADLLQELTRQAPSYKVEVVKERVVVRPTDAYYDAKVRNVDIAKLPRFEAGNRYALELNRQVPQLAELAPPPLLGNPSSPLFTQKVSLSREARVVEHLAELLGEDRKAVFLVVKARSGVPMLAFSLVG